MAANSILNQNITKGPLIALASGNFSGNHFQAAERCFIEQGAGLVDLTDESDLEALAYYMEDQMCFKGELPVANNIRYM